MRSHLLAAVVLATLGACGARERPYRFASPMLGTASVPPAPLPGESAARPSIARRTAPAIRVVSAPKIREASAAAALAVVEAPHARDEARAALPAPHAASAPPTAVHASLDLRTLVGHRDPRDPVTAALGWARQLGASIEATTSTELLAWAEQAGRLASPTAVAAPGDLLVFDHVTSEAEADLVAVVIARDARGVTELVYLGNGVVRRGFVDPSRPAVRRDAELTVVNTFLRHGKRWPAKGSHYLAGELLAHVIRLGD